MDTLRINLSQIKNSQEDNFEPILITVKGIGEEQLEVTRFAKIRFTAA